MQTLHCVLIIINILFVISHESVKATFLANAKVNNNLDNDKNFIHKIRDTSNIKYNEQIDGKNQDNIIISTLLNALKRNFEQKKANENIKVKDKKTDDENLTLLMYDDSGHLIGRSGITITDFLGDMNGLFDGQIVLNNQDSYDSNEGQPRSRCNRRPRCRRFEEISSM